jgi:hypothetical protein
LFYDKANAITLRIECEKLSYLREDTLVKILVEEAKNNEAGKIEEQYRYDFK